MWEAWKDVPFPEVVDKHDERWDDVDPVLVDAELAGLISHVIHRSPLREDQRQMLTSLLDDLQWVLDHVPAEARPYFDRLREMSLLARVAKP